MNAFIKDILREIKHSIGRFLSIMAIVAIGTAFFAGVKASVPDIKKSADTYFDDYKLMDIRMMSNMGFSEDDVKAIKKVDGIEGIFPNYAMDFITHVDTRELVVKAIGFQAMDKDDPNYMNQPALIEGRMPKKKNECLIEADKLKASGFAIGDTITLKSGNRDALSDFLKEDTYTIVGSCFIPDYLSYEKGASSIGSGKVDSFILIDQSNYKMDYYTEILIRVKGSLDVNTYSDAYFTITDDVTSALENVGNERSEIRYEEIKTIANQEWQKQYDKFLEGKTTAENELKSAEKKLEDAKDQLLLGQAELASSKANFETMMLMSEAQITQGEATISMYESQLASVSEYAESFKQQYDSLTSTFDKTIKEEQAKIEELKQQLQDPSLSELEKQLITAEITQRQNIVDNTLKQKQQLDQTLQEAYAQIQNYETMIQDAKQQLITQKQQLKDSKAIAEQEFINAEKKLKDGQASYVNGKIEYEKNKTLVEEELRDAEEKLNAGKEQLNDLPQPTWYVLDRNSHYSYRDYGSVADRMDGIAKIFPVFFLLVAALVCLTTMTRMVDEQRGIIGTYKALGYSKVAIASKYVLYALIAGIIGSIIGCALGMYIFPTIIFDAWNMMYNLPGIVFETQIPLAIYVSISICSVTIIAAIFACYKELIDVPATLMRPKAPKMGKKIILERIPFIWNRFSFTMKVTARNIFRYKKRFLMTVIGISGCTALLLAGFGIQDSISEIVNIQYREIMQYDAMMNFESNTNAIQKNEVLTQLKKDKQVTSFISLSTNNAHVELEDSTQSISIVVPDDANALSDFITIRERKGHAPLKIGNNGAIVSEKLAMNLEATVGDKINITFDDGISREIKIDGIMENYVGHSIYMSPSYYHTLCGYKAIDNTVFIKMMQPSEKSETQLGNTYINQDGVSSLTFYREAADSFDETIASLMIVVVALIVSAGLLAFVVLYNLTNVNISERLREIATIKVLGFYDKEVSSYVYRENIFLTLIGAFSGLVLGIVLHALIMNMAEMPEIMFGRNINFISYGYAVCITMLFAILVNLAMYRKLQKIPMVESLKSVE